MAQKMELPHQLQVDTLAVNDSTLLVSVFREDKLLLKGYISPSGVKINTWKSYYYNSQVRMQTAFTSGLKDGESLHYYSNGKIKAQILFHKGNPHGTWHSYYPNGNELGKIKWNHIHGIPEEIFLYHKSGVLAHEKTYNYDNELVTVRVKSYYKNGAPFENYLFIDSLKSIQANYRKNGLKKFLNTTPNYGIPHHKGEAISGLYTRGFSSGHPWLSLSYEDSKLKEIIYQFDSKNNPIQNEFSSGEGAFNLFHPTGETAFKMKFKNGKPHGYFHSYYPGENTHQTGNFSNGNVNGKWTSYSFSGRILSEDSISSDTLFSLEYGPKNHKYRQTKIVNGFLDGRAHTFDYYGNVDSSFDFKNGFLDGNYKEFFRNNLTRYGSYKSGEQVNQWITKGQFNEISHLTDFEKKLPVHFSEVLPPIRFEPVYKINIPQLFKPVIEEATSYSSGFYLYTKEMFIQELFQTPDSDLIWGTTFLRFSINETGCNENLEMIKSPSREIALKSMNELNYYNFFIPKYINGFPIKEDYFLLLHAYR